MAYIYDATPDHYSTWSPSSETPPRLGYEALYHERAPNCAVCNAPAKERCGCEFASLVVAVEESEERVMGPMLDDVRRWVTSQAQARIHSEFHARAAARRALYPKYTSAEMEGQLQREIDVEWRHCVQRYPEYLDLYYGKVNDAVRAGRGAESIIGGSRGYTSSRHSAGHRASTSSSSHSGYGRGSGSRQHRRGFRVVYTEE